MHVIDVIDDKGHHWCLLAPPLRWNRNKIDEMWLLVAQDTAPDELRAYMEIPVPVFTDWF